MDKPQERPAGTPIWKWVIIGLVTACIVTLVALFPAFKAPPATSVVETKHHERGPGGFIINYSGDWNQLSDTELKNLQGSFTFALEHAKKPDALIGIRSGPDGSKKVKLKDAAREMDKTMRLRFKRFKKISQANIRIKSGEEALRYEYRFFSNDRIYIRAVALVVPAKDSLYFVSALTGEKNYEGMKPRIEKVVDSFEVD